MNCTVANSDVSCMLTDVSITGPNEGGKIQVSDLCEFLIFQVIYLFKQNYDEFRS